ncbi:MAG TPA: hypothetical protein VHF05_02925, partial [Candidatus Paceibacterota bacterium]|nr:hypothetical protein [Candidatus Paceibacterota bacterium]
MLISDLDGTLSSATGRSDSRPDSLRLLRPREGALELLTLPNFRNFLVSTGEIHTETIKLGVLKFGHLFHGIYTVHSERDKRFVFEELFATHGRGL